MKSFFPAIRKNENLRNRLASEITNGRFPHAYIISGDTGSGKRTLAINIAAALECKDHETLPCGKCDSCQKILGGFSPDVIHIKKDSDKKEFTVNLIREIKESLYIAPNELKKRVYIIEGAETMNQNAQNAFLKMLEEPPAYIVFLLLCSNTENLLDTIKSRAPILAMEHIPSDIIKEFLLENSPAARELFNTSPDEINKIIISSNGSIGHAVSLCEDSDKHIKTQNLVTAFLSAWTSPFLAELNLFCDQLPATSDEFSDFLSLLSIALRDISLLKCDSDINMLFFTDKNEAEEFASKITCKKALKLIKACESLKDKIKFYLDLKLAAITFCGDARKIMIE